MINSPGHSSYPLRAPGLLLLGLPAVVDHLDDARKILRAAATADEPLVELLGLAPHRRVGAGLLRCFHRQLRVLEHQRGGEAAFIIVVGGSLAADARDRRVASHRPALPG